MYEYEKDGDIRRKCSVASVIRPRAETGDACFGNRFGE